jgi:hypothetical protein
MLDTKDAKTKSHYGKNRIGTSDIDFMLEVIYDDGQSSDARKLSRIITQAVKAAMEKEGLSVKKDA